MSDVIGPQPSARTSTTPEFRLWLRLIVSQYTQRAMKAERREYWRRFFTSWVADDPNPTYSPLDNANGLRDNLEP